MNGAPCHLAQSESALRLLPARNQSSPDRRRIGGGAEKILAVAERIVFVWK
jgi:hypothetical protein